MYSTNAKNVPPKKVFGNSEFCSSCQNHSRPNSLENSGFGRKNKTQSFQELFFRGYLFAFVEYFCNRSLKIKTKNIKNCGSILTIVNHWNWLDDSPSLSLTELKNCLKILSELTLNEGNVLINLPNTIGSWNTVDDEGWLSCCAN